MNADAFRQLYEYHFAENRKVWNYITQLSPEQFTEGVGYSHGSVREQVTHIMDVDEIWFVGLQNSEPTKALPAPGSDDRESIRAHWDVVEQNMRGYLADLRDDMLFTRPIQEPDEDRDLIVWQVLLHVVNHGTDHRAQLLRSLSDMGVKTDAQDYIFYVYEHQ